MRYMDFFVLATHAEGKSHLSTTRGLRMEVYHNAHTTPYQIFIIGRGMRAGKDYSVT